MRPDGVSASAVHPMLAEAFEALDAAWVGWCVLRGERTLADPSGDVDILADRDGLQRLDEVLADHSFLRLQRWGAGGHRHYLGYHEPTDRWLEIDVEHEIEFGPTSNFLVNWIRPSVRIDAARSVLARRRRSEGVWVPDSDDAFWLLLLHCAIDKAAVADRHRERLRELVDAATADGPLAVGVTACCPAGWTATRMIGSVRAGRWGEIVDAGSELPRRATRMRPVRARASALGRGLYRLGSTALRAGEGRGFSVALLGPDGAGKSTLAEGLVSSLGLPARLVYMGLWQGEGESGEPVPLARAVLAAAARPLKSWRRAAIGLYHLSRGRIVVHDRHPFDALIPPEPPHLRLKRGFFAFLAHSVPSPSLALVLDLPAEVTRRRRPDEDPDRLDVARRQYLQLGTRLPRAQILPADRSVDEVRTDALGRIWRALLARRHPTTARVSRSIASELPVQR
jgi:thymidylate kinase